MKYATGLFLIATSGVSAFAPSSQTFIPAKIGEARRSQVSRFMADDEEQFDQEKFIAESKEMRLKHLEEQAMFALKVSCENYGNAVFPNALIAGDVVITHLLDRLGYLKDGKCTIMCVDTFHLFPETMEFLKEIEDHYGFKAEVFCAEGVDVGDKDGYDSKYGANLWKEDIEQYDKVCKVEPFQRGLKTLETDVMINGRRRDHGAERAYIDIAEVAPIGGGLAKLNPLAYWTLEDCFDYAAANGVPLHPTVALGYPSQGDYKDTVPVPDPDGLSGFQGDAGSVKWVDGAWTGDKAIWLDYGNERKGRFVGLVNKDGSAKTECGIHVAGAEQTFDRDLWESGAVSNLETQESALALKDGVVVVYAPWCQFCQAMEDDYATFADEMAKEGITVAKYRGDEDREFVTANFNTESFPTINLVKDGVATKYDSEARDVESLKKFAMSG